MLTLSRSFRLLVLLRYSNLNKQIIFLYRNRNRRLHYKCGRLFIIDIKMINGLASP